MSEKNRFSKPVAFNNKNEEDQLILKHVKRRNFSGYVKKLILADIEKGKEMKRLGEAEKQLKAYVSKPVEVQEEVKPAIQEEQKPVKQQKEEKKPQTATSKLEELRARQEQQKRQSAPPMPQLFIKKG